MHESIGICCFQAGLTSSALFSHTFTFFIHFSFVFIFQLQNLQVTGCSYHHDDYFLVSSFVFILKLIGSFRQLLLTLFRSVKPRLKLSECYLKKFLLL